MPFAPPYDLYAQSPCVDQFRDAHDHDSSYPRGVRSYCQSFDHDVNSCPYYDKSDELYARLNAIMKTMSEQHEHFVSEMRSLVYCMRLTLVYLSLGMSLVPMMIMSLPFP